MVTLWRSGTESTGLITTIQLMKAKMYSVSMITDDSVCRVTISMRTVVE